MCSECDKGKTGPIGMFVAPTMGNVRPEFITAETCIQEHLYTDKAPTFSIAAGCTKDEMVSNYPQGFDYN